MLMEDETINKELYDEFDDNTLVRLAQNGDGLAMENILIRYKRMVKRKASKLFIAGGDYDDVIQEGMIGLFKAVRNYKENKGVPFSSFAVYCVLAQITDAVRKASRNKHNALNLSISLQGLALREEDDPYSLLDVYIDISKADPEQLAISKEEYESLSVFTQKELTKNEREALLLFIAGFTYAEIAAKLERTVKSIDNAIQRAREKFEIFKKQYFY